MLRMKLVGDNDFKYVFFKNGFYDEASWKIISGLSPDMVYSFGGDRVKGGCYDRVDLVFKLEELATKIKDGSFRIVGGEEDFDETEVA